jgi:1-acyl-sn-glycerol-3-phosphate acyltransferase
MVCVQEYADEAVGWTGRRESVSIRILPPIETEGLTAEDIPELIERCHRKMSETIATL